MDFLTTLEQQQRKMGVNEIWAFKDAKLSINKKSMWDERVDADFVDLD